jgi:hypothetical protein
LVCLPRKRQKISTSAVEIANSTRKKMTRRKDKSEINLIRVRFQLLTVVSMKMTAIWDITQCSLT